MIILLLKVEYQINFNCFQIDDETLNSWLNIVKGNKKNYLIFCQVSSASHGVALQLVFKYLILFYLNILQLNA